MMLSQAYIEDGVDLVNKLKEKTEIFKMSCKKKDKAKKPDPNEETKLMPAIKLNGE